MRKLTRKEISEGLKQAPIEHILVGANNAKKVNLTKKQKDFARLVAEGKPKAQAYRETYNTQASKQNQAVQAHKTANNPKIATMIESFKVANEAREYLIPAQIRTMAIQNLVTIAIDEEEKTSNKLKALELIGKMSEVQLFSERKEHIHLHHSSDIKEQLLDGLKLIFSNSRTINDLAKRKAESLLVELSEPIPAYDTEADQVSEENSSPPHVETGIFADPPTHDPKLSAHIACHAIHSIPLTQPSPNVTSPPDEVTDSSTESTTYDFIQGEGVDNLPGEDTKVIQETPPVSVLNEKG